MAVFSSSLIHPTDNCCAVQFIQCMFWVCVVRCCLFMLNCHKVAYCTCSGCIAALLPLKWYVSQIIIKWATHCGGPLVPTGCAAIAGAEVFATESMTRLCMVWVGGWLGARFFAGKWENNVKASVNNWAVPLQYTDKVNFSQQIMCIWLSTPSPTMWGATFEQVVSEFSALDDEVNRHSGGWVVLMESSIVKYKYFWWYKYFW